MRAFTVVSACLLCANAFAAAFAQAPARSTNDGVFSAAQVEMGRSTFRAKCSDCHEPSYFEDALLDQWTNKPLSALYEMIASNMPANKPGSLTAQEYADVLSFLLQLNGVRPGDSTLRGAKEAMAAIRFDPPSDAKQR